MYRLFIFKSLDFVNRIVSIATSDKDKIQQLLSDDSLTFYNFFLSSTNYLDVSYKLKYADKDIGRLSPGEKGTLLLIFYLLLDKDNIPLIIDQPEDNLDNEFIYEKLVPCIRRVKDRRQVFIVTHNPNIAVACDAEQIICCSIAKEDDNEISYESGSIEDSIMNAHITDILEGTIPAFIKRKLRYQVN